ncbi:MAG: hypothetical protein ACXW2G_06060 [Burkholderiaceae bacterium]
MRSNGFAVRWNISLQFTGLATQCQELGPAFAVVDCDSLVGQMFSPGCSSRTGLAPSLPERMERRCVELPLMERVMK